MKTYEWDLQMNAETIKIMGQWVIFQFFFKLLLKELFIL